MNKKRGFTLVEVLAVLVIMGLLLAIAAPNVLKMINSNKKELFMEDARKFLSTAKAIILEDKSIERPKNENEATVVSLAYTESEDFVNSALGFTYNRAQSFIVETRKKNNFNYYVVFVACGNRDTEDSYKLCTKGDKVVGYDLIKEEDLLKDGAYNRIAEGKNRISKYIYEKSSGITALAPPLVRDKKPEGDEKNTYITHYNYSVSDNLIKVLREELKLDINKVYAYVNLGGNVEKLTFSDKLNTDI